jgi:DNA-binding transcriptional LysR family regulator
MLDPARLRLLQVVARTGSYSAAARELGYTQPAITYQMRCLERSTGSAITVRKGRTMQLTPAGRLLLEHADRILATIRGAEHELAALAGVSTGSVRLAAFPSSCASLVPAAMVSMRRSHPGVGIELVQAELPQAREHVQRGDVDLALGYHFGPCQHEAAGENDTMRRLPVTVDDVHLILPADHRAAHNRVIGIEELAADTWIIASPNFHEMLAAAAAAFGFVPQVMRVADDYVTMQSLVAHGLGVALVPNLALTAHRDNRVVPRTLRDWPRRHVEVELWPDMLRVTAVRVLVDHLTAAAARIANVSDQTLRSGLPH